MIRSVLGRDPAELMERQERMKLLAIAKKIFRLSEAQWESRVQLLPTDQQEPVRKMLVTLKEHERCRA